MAETSALRPKSFREYWPYYVGEHSDRRLRAYHNRSIFAALLIATFVLGSSWSRSSLLEGLIIALFTLFAVGYGLVFASHWAVEGKPPTTNPAAQGDKGQILKELLWSVMADYKMLWLTLNEKLEAELTSHNAK